MELDSHSDCVRREGTDPSKAYFLSFSKASGASDKASARIAGQWS